MTSLLPWGTACATPTLLPTASTPPKDASTGGATNAPVHKLRYGSVDAAIWKNTREGLAGDFFGVTLSRRFKQGEEWKESKSFDERDLPTVAKAANDAHSWIQGAKLPRTSGNTTDSDAKR